MNPFEFLWKVVTALKPSESNDPTVQSAWRWSVASVLSSLVVVYAVSFAWAQGWIPGMSGVALASDMSSLKVSVDGQLKDMRRKTDVIQLILIKNGIENAMRDSCTAQQRANQAALDMANATLYGREGTDGLIDQYFELTGHQYDKRDCRALLISTTSP